jgi:hypothetical protein
MNTYTHQLTVTITSENIPEIIVTFKGTEHELVSLDLVLQGKTEYETDYEYQSYSAICCLLAAVDDAVATSALSLIKEL